MKTHLTTLWSIFLFSVLFFLSLVVNAAIPSGISYQGYLNDASGNPVNGAVNLTFRLYTTETDGAASWVETHSSVNVSEGIFAVQLGSSSAFSSGLFNSTLWLSTQVNNDSEMSPRQPLLAVPYAINSQNADKVDGLEANEIIDAAADESRTPITSLPFTITDSGSYYLTSNLDANGSSENAITIAHDFVTIDLNGFTLRGGANNGIYVQASDVTIVNGSIRNFTKAGIIDDGRIGIRLIDIRTVDNGLEGIRLSGDSNTIINSSSISNGGDGISVGEAKIIDSTANRNSGNGISAGDGSMIKNCMINSNEKSGINASASTVVNNIIRRNNSSAYQGGYAGIDVGNGSIVEGNTVVSNFDWGISTYGIGSVIRDNIISGNNIDSANDQGGLRLGENSHAKGNTLINNGQMSIYVQGVGNILEENYVTIDGVGIYFANELGGNAVRNNSYHKNYNGATLYNQDDVAGNNTIDSTELEF